jgi:putative peptidoglycan lipid II flippase
VASAGLITIAAALISRLLGMGREIAIAHNLGQNALADVYKQAFMVPDILFILLSSGALVTVFMPVFTGYLEQGDEKRAWHFFSNVVTIVALVICACVVAGEVFVHPLTRLLNPGWTENKLEWQLLETARLTRIVLPTQFCFFVGSILISVQYAFKRFKLPSAGSMVYNAFIIAGGLSLSGANPITRALGYPGGLGAAGFSWGALVGAVVGNLVIQGIGVWRLGGRYRPVIDWNDPGLRTFGRLIVPIIFTLSLPLLDMQVNKLFATFLKEGSVASLDYANRLMQLPLGILAQASAVAIYPFIATQAARNDMVSLRRSLNMAVRTITAMTVPASALLIVLAEPVVRLVYQHGKFTASDTRFTASVLVCYSLGIAAWSAQTVLARGFYALQDTKTPMITGTYVTGIFVLMNAALVGPFKDQGLAMSTSIAATILALWLFFRLQKRLGGMNGALIMRSFVKVCAASAVMAVPVYLMRLGLSHWFTPTAIDSTTAMGTGAASAVVFLCAAFGIVLYVILLWVMRAEEARFFYDRLLARKQTAQR